MGIALFTLTGLLLFPPLICALFPLSLNDPLLALPMIYCAALASELGFYLLPGGGLALGFTLFSGGDGDSCSPSVLY